MDPNIPAQPAQNEIPPVQPNPLSQPIIQQPVNNIVPSGNKGKWIIFIIILLIIVGGGAYYLGLKQNKLISQNQRKQITPGISQSSPTPTPNPTANWKTYTSPSYNPFYTDAKLQARIAQVGANDPTVQKIQFSIMYPPDWQQGYDNVGTQGQYGYGYTFTNNGKVIKIGLGYAPGGNLCNPPLVASFSAQFSSSLGTLRRVTAYEGEQIPNGDTEFTICMGNGSVFYSNTSIGKISYILPDNYAPSDLVLMDSIVGTIKETAVQNQAGPTANWKTYTSLKGNYSIEYPPDWYAYEYNDANSSVNISDVSNPEDIPQSVSPQGHTSILLSAYQGAMPTTFPYTNGSGTNSTIKQFSINSYTGIRGEQTSTLGLGEAVYLNNPKGGYVELVKQIDNNQMFDQILSTFKFTN